MNEISLEYELTNKEREIVALVCEGLSNKEIAKRTFRTVNTVKTHLRNIYEKLDIKGKRFSKRFLLVKEMSEMEED